MTVQSKTVSLVMPCRNECANLEIIFNGIPDFVDEIICVSNRSTDGTYEEGIELQKRYPKLRMLKDDRSINGIGYGFAHLTGLNAATGDIVVCSDADGTYPIEDTPRIMLEMGKRKLLAVSCSRYPDKNIPIKLQLGVKLLNLEIFLLYGYIIHDSLSGMWVFHREVIQELKLTAGDWNLSPQVKLNAKKYLHNQFAEIKILQKQRIGETKQNYFETGIRHVLWILKNRFKQQ